MNQDKKRRAYNPYKTKGHKTVWLIMLFALAFSFSLFAFAPKVLAAENSTYYTNHASGWYWYHDPALQQKGNAAQTEWPEKAAAESANTIQQASRKPLSPTEQMKVVRQKVEAAFDKAFMYPTRENVAAYIALQNAVVNRSGKLATEWQAALLAHPNLDYLIQHPISQQASAIHTQMTEQAETAAIHRLAQTNGLFFFYRGNCPYCHAFAPILKRFAESYGFTIMPISIGNGFLPDFPHSRVDSGQAAALHITNVPALFLVNPKTRTIAPVSYGYLNEQDLFERLALVARLLSGRTAVSRDTAQEIAHR